MKKQIKYVAIGLTASVILFAAVKGSLFYRDYKIEKSLLSIDRAESPFSFEKLASKAKALSELPFAPPGNNLPKELQDIDYDGYRSIRFKREKGPWYGTHKPFEVQFFHAGALFQNSVKINEVINGRSYPLTYSPDFFNFGHNRLNTANLSDIGYAGFRLHYPLNTDDYFDELISFLGASYFRALAEGQKYGISARGLAIDTAVSTGEEFPIFREFWLQRPRWYDNSAVVYALLDSPSITGAYKFTIIPGADTIVNVEARLFARKDIGKLGVAPLTSMYLFAENTKNKFDDFRPEVHDSDGLLILNANGEWLWRPLDNSKYLRISNFSDENPKGFGLLQRDRDLSHYLDFEAHYEQRPSVWVEPIGDWGKGVVELVEIPSDQEIHDNVVAYWVPAEKVTAGKELTYSYNLHWFTDLPVEKIPGDITATRTGIGGVSGQLEIEKRKFVIDFDILNMQEEVEKGIAVLEVSASEGEIVQQQLIYNPTTGGLTAYIDFKPNGKISELRASVVKKGRHISEIWSYQWLP